MCIFSTYTLLIYAKQRSMHREIFPAKIDTRTCFSNAQLGYPCRRPLPLHHPKDKCQLLLQKKILVTSKPNKKQCMAFFWNSPRCRLLGADRNRCDTALFLRTCAISHPHRASCNDHQTAPSHPKIGFPPSSSGASRTDDEVNQTYALDSFSIFPNRSRSS